MRPLKTFLFLFALLLLLPSCRKEDDLGPNSLFECYIDGEFFGPYRKGDPSFGSGGSISSNYYEKDYDGQLGVLVLRDIKGEIYTNVFNIVLLGTNNDKPLIFAFLHKDKGFSDQCVVFEKMKDSHVDVTITKIDTIKKRIIGTFEGEIFNSCGDSKTVSDGKFNLRPTWFK